MSTDDHIGESHYYLPMSHIPIERIFSPNKRQHMTLTFSDTNSCTFLLKWCYIKILQPLSNLKRGSAVNMAFWTFMTTQKWLLLLLQKYTLPMVGGSKFRKSFTCFVNTRFCIKFNSIFKFDNI